MVTDAGGNPWTCNYGAQSAQSVAGTAFCPPGYRATGGNLFCFNGMQQGTILYDTYYWGACCPFPGAEANTKSNSGISVNCMLSSAYEH